MRVLWFQRCRRDHNHFLGCCAWLWVQWVFNSQAFISTFFATQMASIPPNENDNTNNNAQDVKDVAKKLTDLHLIASSIPTDPSLGSQFKYADEENIHKEFICCICFAPFLNPVTHSSCGNMFCRQCLQTQQSCPLCRGTLGNSIQPVPKPVLNFLDALKACILVIF